MINKNFLDALSKTDARWDGKQEFFLFGLIGFLNDKDSKPSSNEDLVLEIVANGKILDEKIALDEKVFKVLTKTNTKEESLSKNATKLLTCIKAES